MSLTALVVDDEPTARQFLRLLLERQDDVEVVGEAENGEEALRLAEELRPHVVFLDIQMPEMTGLEVARAMQGMEECPWVVFATGYDEYAVEAFDAAAIDYLMKPYDEERLEKAIQRLRRLQDPGGSAEGERERVAQEISRLARPGPAHRRAAPAAGLRRPRRFAGAERARGRLQRVRHHSCHP